MDSLSRIKDKDDEKESIYGLSTGRIENLSDGVFSIAMTLLVLDLKPINYRTANPVLYIEHLLKQLAPMLFTFVIVFIVLASFWVAHHVQFKYILKANRTYLWINILFLMGVAFMPFSTYLMHAFERTPLAITIFCLNMIYCQVFLLLGWFYANDNNHLLVSKSIDPRIVNYHKWRGLVVFIACLAIIVLSFYFQSNTLLLFILIPLIQMLMQRKMLPPAKQIK